MGLHFLTINTNIIHYKLINTLFTTNHQPHNHIQNEGRLHPWSSVHCPEGRLHPWSSVQRSEGRLHPWSSVHRSEGRLHSWPSVHCPKRWLHSRPSMHRILIGPVGFTELHGLDSLRNISFQPTSISLRSILVTHHERSTLGSSYR